MKKRLFLLVLALCLLAMPVPAAEPAAETADHSGIEYRIRQMQTEFGCGDGAYFTDTGSACAHDAHGTCEHCELQHVLSGKLTQHSIFSDAKNAGLESGCYTCRSFATFAWYAIYGQDTAGRRKGDKFHDVSQLQYGDFVCVEEPNPNKPGYYKIRHYGIFVGWVDQVGKAMYLYDSNGQAGIDGYHVNQIVEKSRHDYTKVDSKYITCFHASNYDAINELYRANIHQHEWDGLGVCSCGTVYNWQANISASINDYRAGVYRANAAVTVRSQPYREAPGAGKLKENELYDVVEMTTNAFGNLWLHVRSGGIDGWEYYSYLDFQFDFPVSVTFADLSVGSITSTNAFFKATVQKPTGYRLVKYGIVITPIGTTDPTGELLRSFSAKERMQGREQFVADVPNADQLQAKSSFQLTVDLNSEAGIFLQSQHCYSACLTMLSEDACFYSDDITFAAVPAGGSVHIEAPPEPTEAPEPTNASEPTDAPAPPTTVVTLAPTDDSAYKAREFITDTNACVVTKITKTPGTGVSRSGVLLMDSDGNVIKDYWHTVTNVGRNTAVFHAWYDMNSEVGVTLTPGTAYQYRFHVTVDGRDYEGNVRSFTTKGTAPVSGSPPVTPPPGDVTLTVSSAAVRSGEVVRFLWSAENAAGFWFYILDQQTGILYGDDLENNVGYELGLIDPGYYQCWVCAYNANATSESRRITVEVLAGEPASTRANPFLDVEEADYFYGAVLWAYYFEPQVTNGKSAAAFGPGDPVTRAQAVTFLWRSAGCPEPMTAASPFADVTDPGAWYYKAVLWASERGITNGVGGGRFGLDGTLTYDQMLTFMARAAGADASGDHWSEKALTWADGSGLTDGLTVTAKGDCPRRDAVYFLWKQMA